MTVPVLPAAPVEDRAAEIEALVARTRTFVREVVLPVEDAHDGDVEAAGGETLRVRLQAAAREAAVLAPHAPVEFGGLGLSMVERAAVFEEAGYGLFGPLATHVAAPDEGNVHLLDHVATAAQRERFLAPLARAEVRSAFAMTEPAPGAGADPSMLTTRATRVDGGWTISGRKWFITGADGAAFFIVMARTSGEPGGAGGATMFLVPAGTPGLEVVRHVGTVDRAMLGGHCELALTDVFVPDDDVLGGVDEGFRYAQVRLGPARMTHVMRWTGAARRAHEVAVAHVAGRRAFGSRLADLGLMQQLIADNEIDLAATRALLLEACRALDAGGRASKETSIAKTFAAEALDRVADRAQQMCGGLGVSTELPVARIARELRPFRIYDGPSEVHRWSIAKRAVRAIAGDA
ncbi:acyl-CoA dehydrogenase family protein [Nocardioides sp. TRM66260-LWL]|uniref:acyl-CoA dehydrogenase family protein n=1 Tax=Nocardioides sp. TRM66260-LWL TaxID=2874478 RepID=UPI001CC4D246|nr:acyl-CoA dehydrogenase family protein [Nocardioides sp. TRM66260-LWL]MBZ5734759.1 acyl-CoA dehydrogenase family protein [Nocardioides sp. TRM66260-LWL]